MSAIGNVLDEHERRVAAITAIAIEVGALVLSESAGEPTSTVNPNAEKLVYAKAFRAWADGAIEGIAEDIFETVGEVLDA
ncbi:hypothetical protein KUL72_11500 [Bradyrhizobium arachidis]|uniref:hypothetical protein n=1 Tax=Bradyrhizobium TaxID=374 RepID=UPI00188BC12B|nr:MULTISPECIES: hypothetical protein [Bradyrhizobium]QOZ51759.1 hypothetical protein XH90_10510 [Bradyrhizobium sp. CCBAU 53338]UVO38931.1 hypothetical protein KUL72_11500 [Bradyrhizobium arachidis]